MKCDMAKECISPVTHIDENGFVYCFKHGIQRKNGGWKRCRQLRTYEINRIRKGLKLAHY